jgi:hypothetical protein
MSVRGLYTVDVVGVRVLRMAALWAKNIQNNPMNQYEHNLFEAVTDYVENLNDVKEINKAIRKKYRIKKSDDLYIDFNNPKSDTLTSLARQRLHPPSTLKKKPKRKKR